MTKPKTPPQFPGRAIKDRTGKILVETIYPTQRGAMVNWLVTQNLAIPTTAWPDEMVQEDFLLCAAKRQALIIPVIITEAP